MLRSSASSLFLDYSRKLFCRGLTFERSDSPLKTERCCSISRFRVYAGRPNHCAKIRAGSVCSTTHRSGRPACFFGLRKPAHRSGWVAVPRTPASFSTVRNATRSLKKDGGSEDELDSRQQAPAKRGVRIAKAASNNTRKVQQRASHEDEPSSAGKAKKVGLNPKTRDFRVNEEISGNDAHGVTASSKKLGGRVVIVGSELSKPNLQNPNGKLSKDPNFLHLSGITTDSAAVDSNSSEDRIRSRVIRKASAAMNSNHDTNSRRHPAADKSKPKQQMEKKPKKKDFPAEATLRRDLNMCSKDGDVLRALDIYASSVADGVVKWTQYNFNILLYLCSSAALGTLTARKSGTDRANSERLNLKSTEQNSDGYISSDSPSTPNGAQQQQDGPSHEETRLFPIVVSPEIMELAAQRGFEIFEDMKKQSVQPNEATLTAVARLAIRKEDGDLAFQMVKEMAAQNIAPKLRSYSPALVTFCKSKAVEKALEVDAHMVAAGVQPEEPELGALLQLCVELGLEKEVYALLHRLRVKVRALSLSTIASVEEWFSGQRGGLAGVEEKQPEAAAVRGAMEAGGGGWHGLGWLGKGNWKVDWTTIDSDGLCRSCRSKLVTIDLDPKDTDKFADSVAELAFQRASKPIDFKRFQDWLDRHGPFDAIIDGANVGLYNQNFQQGGFNFFQLNAVAQAALDRGFVKKPPLIVLHHARTKFGAANSPLGQQLLKKWSSSNTLYTTPNGSNDDWYWMYAAVRNKGLLITNDEMRDHLFQLLGSDFFPKWKERHQVRFSATSQGLDFHLPPPYSSVIQECENGSWHIPKDAGDELGGPHEWMCVTRPGSSLESAASPGSEPTATPAKNGTIPTPHDELVEGKNETDEIALDSHNKRLRVHTPPSAVKKIRVADNQSTCGPIANA